MLTSFFTFVSSLLNRNFHFCFPGYEAICRQ
jgi:hypothetical protein